MNSPSLSLSFSLLQEAELSPKLPTKPIGSAKKPGKKGKETPGLPKPGSEDIPLPQKPPTMMKKRGEEDTDSKYIGKQ